MNKSLYLPTLRILYFSILFLFIQQSNYFQDWASLPTAFWQPSGILHLFKAPPLSIWAMTVLILIWKSCLVFSAVGLLYNYFAPTAVFVGLFIGTYSHSFGYQGHVYMPCLLAGLPLAFSAASSRLSLDRLFFIKSLDVVNIDRLVFLNMQLVFCSVFFLAGLSKLTNSGLEWITTDTLRNYILRGQFLYGDTNQFLKEGSAIGFFLYNNPMLCHVIAGAVVIIELLSPAAMFSKKAAVFIIPLIFCMQVGIYFSVGVNFKPYLLLYLCWLPNILDLWSRKKLF